MRALIAVLLLTLPSVAQDTQPGTTAEAEQPFAPPLLETQELQEVRDQALEELAEYWQTDQPAEPDALALDLPEAVRIALQQNPQVLVAQDEVDAARAQIGQAKAERLPQLGVRSAFVYMPDASSPIGNLGFLSNIIGGGLEPDETFRRDELNVRQTLYAGGQIMAAIRASRFLAQSREWELQATLNDLEFQTKEAYNNVLLARALTRVAQESVITFERHLADTQQMFDVGLVSQFEVLRARTELSARQSDWVAAKNAERLALVNLKRILALPQAQPVRLTGSLDIEPLEKNLDQLLMDAVDNRPELLALNRAISAAEQNVRGARGRYLPRAAATADYVNVEDGGVVQPDGWTVTVGAEWDIFAGGRRRSQVAEARAQASSLNNQREDVRQLIELDVRQAYIQMQDALAKINEERATVEFAREGLRLAQLRFQEGVGTQVEILDAELALTSAESSLIQALRDYAVARASIERATGSSWFPGVTAEEVEQSVR